MDVEVAGDLVPGGTATATLTTTDGSTINTVTWSQTSGVEAAPAEGPAGEEQAPEWEKAVQDLTTDLERTVNEIEEAARERPALALLAAFTIGIVVGHLLARR